MTTFGKSVENLRADGLRVISYTTHVATINHDNRTIDVLGYWSRTTSKHIGIVARHFGYKQVKKY